MIKIAAYEREEETEIEKFIHPIGWILNRASSHCFSSRAKYHMNMEPFMFV